MKYLLAFGAIGGFFFAFMMPYMPSPGWTLLIIFCYALGGVAFFNWYMSRKETRIRTVDKFRKSSFPSQSARTGERFHFSDIEIPITDKWYSSEDKPFMANLFNYAAYSRLRSSLFAAMNKGSIKYKFYRRDGNRKDQFIGSLIERRKKPDRITCASIMNYAKYLSFKDVFEERVYFIRVEIIRSEPLHLQK